MLVPKASIKKASIDEALQITRDRYIQRRPNSAKAQAAARKVMPGGNTRTVLYHDPIPLRVVSGRGAYITDADGHRYLNLLGEYTAGLFGHSHPIIRDAINQALDSGLNLSAHNIFEVELARIVCKKFPSIDRVRFTNSGTEANLLAVSAARHHTGREKILVFHGGYHGGLLYFNHGGIPINAPFPYLLCDYNDIHGTQQIIREHADDLACVLVEPMLGSAGCIPGSTEFLDMLRSETKACEAVLIFDEVMTSRLSYGGAQQLEGIVPDMTTLGKYIGGGMSFGAFGGAKDIMDIFNPEKRGSLPHAGTFNNNTLTMATGVAAMQKIYTSEVAHQHNQRGDQLRQRLNTICLERQLSIQFTGRGSLMSLHGKSGPISSPKDLHDSDDRIKELMFLELLEKGYYIARRGFIALMLPTTDAELDDFVKSFKNLVDIHMGLLSK